MTHARMLGRYQVPGHCPGSRAGRVCTDCWGGESMTARGAKRVEARWLAKDIAEQLADMDDDTHDQSARHVGDAGCAT
jgi:hypothetical protein